MRVLVDWRTHAAGTPLVTQVEDVPSVGVEVPVNAKYALPIVPTTDFEVTSDDYVLPIDGGDISSRSYAHLLAMYPSYDYIYFNPLLTEANVGELDPDAEYIELDAPAPWGPAPPNPPVLLPTRAQMGRPLTAPEEEGQYPMMTAVLAQNDATPTTLPPHPGMLITDNIDISAQTGPGGADEFMVYWKLYDLDVTDDLQAPAGVGGAPGNSPALLNLSETDQEPSGFSVYISTDDGTTWCEVGLLEGVSFVAATTAFRLAFKNTSSSKIYIASFAVLF